jgi:hypothetical protein
MALTDTAIRNAKPREREYKLADAGGLYLLITPPGGKLWRLKFRSDGRERKLAIGSYPEISLSDARKRRDESRELLAVGKDPSREKQRVKVRARLQAENTFAGVAAEYCEKRKRDGHKAWAPATATRSEYLLGLLYGPIGRMPITEIEPGDVLAAIRKVEAKGNLESARRMQQLASAVFRYAVATARLASDPRLRSHTMAPSLKPAASVSCCAPSMGMRGRASQGLPCNLPRMCLCAPVSCAMLSGQRLI